jgi:hypothetical protein
MNVLSVTTAIALAASLAGFSPSMVSAAAPADVLIQAHPTQFVPQEIGTWEASGAITDSGSFVRTELAVSPPDREFGELGPVREVFVFSSSQGTLTVREQARDTSTGVTGVWEIASGTGAYDGASGHGTVAFDGPTLTLFLTGVIQSTD